MDKNNAQKIVTVTLTAEQARSIYLLATRDGSFDWFGKNCEKISIFDQGPETDVGLECSDGDVDIWEKFEETVDAVKDQLLAQGVDLEGPA